MIMNAAVAGKSSVGRLSERAVDDIARVVDDSLWASEGGGVSDGRCTDTLIIKGKEKPVGFDYIKASFAGSWLGKPDSLFSLLESGKSQAFEAGARWWEVEFNGTRLLVAGYSGGGRGSNHRRYRLQWHGIGFEVSGREGAEIGVAVEIRGSELMRHGLVGSLEICRQFLELVCFDARESRVSRADIFCDVKSFTPGDLFAAFQENRMVSRARDVNPWFNAAGRVCTSFNVGTRKGRSLMRCYDKLFELSSQPEKLGLYESRFGKLDRDEHGKLSGVLTRVEFEIGREGLKSSGLGVSSVEDLLARLVAVVEYLTVDFVRFSSRSVNRTNTRREEISGEWSQISRELQEFAAEGQFGVVDALPVGELDLGRDKAMAYGYLVRFFARRGVEIPDTYHGFAVLLERLVTGDLWQFAEAVNVKARELRGASIFESEKTCIVEAIIEAERIEALKPKRREPFVRNEQTMFDLEWSWSFQ